MPLVRRPSICVCASVFAQGHHSFQRHAVHCMSAIRACCAGHPARSAAPGLPRVPKGVWCMVEAAYIFDNLGDIRALAKPGMSAPQDWSGGE